MRIEKKATWEREQNHMGGRGESFGTVPVYYGAQYMAVGKGRVLAGKWVKGYCMKYVFGRSRGEDESLAGLMCDLCLSLRISLSKKRRLVAKLEVVEEVEGAVKCLEHMRVIVSRNAVTLGKLETLLGPAQVMSLWTFSVANGLTVLLSMAALYILDKLVEVASSSRQQDKMKRLIAELETLGQRAEALKPLYYMKDMIVCDFATLGVLEQLLAGTHVGMRLKASYVAEMEETD
nr:hypothetical protein [Tanacetum cinerariifolium]